MAVTARAGQSPTGRRYGSLAEPLGNPFFWIGLTCRAVVVLASAGSAVVAVAVVAGVLSRTEVLSPEGSLLYSILRVRDGLPLYTDWREYPFIFAMYTPLYYVVAGLGARVASLDVDGTLILARTIPALAALVSALLVGALARACGASWPSSLVGGGLFATSFVVQPWAYTARPDFLALSIALAGLVIGSRATARGSCVLAAAVLAAAFFAKQSYLVGVAALVLHSLAERRPARAAWIAGTWICCVGVGSIALQRATDGLFSLNIMSTVAAPWDGAFLIGAFWRVPVFSVVVLFLAARGWRGDGTEPGTWRLVRWYGGLALAYGLATVGKAGALSNYFLEATAACAVLAAVGFDRLRRQTGERGGRSAIPGTLGAVAGCLVVVVGACLSGAFLLANATLPRDSGRLLDVLRATPGEVLTERDSLAVVQAGKLPIFADVFGMTILGTAWDPAPLNELVERQGFALIVLRAPVEQPVAWNGYPWWPPGTRERIASAYQLIERDGPYFIYGPSGR